MPEEGRRVVVLGVAHSHVEHLAAVAKTLGGVTVVAWDADAHRLVDASQRMQVEAADSLASVLAMKPQLALIGSVPDERADLMLRAMAAGASVLTDKPLALNLDDLQRVRAASEKHGRPVMIFWPYRSYPQLLATKHAIDDGRIGRVVRVFCSGPHKLNADRRPAWHWNRSTNGTPMIDVGSHHADLCCYLAGSPPRGVSARRTKFTHPEHPEFSDFEHAIIEFDNGAAGYVEVDWLQPESFETFGDTRVWVLGTKGKIEVRLGDEVSALIWNRDQAGEPLELPETDSLDDWIAGIMSQLIKGDLTELPQTDVWQACGLTLAAAASADRGGEWIKLQPEFLP